MPDGSDETLAHGGAAACRSPGGIPDVAGEANRYAHNGFPSGVVERGAEKNEFDEAASKTTRPCVSAALGAMPLVLSRKLSGIGIGADVRMVQRGDGARFALESFAETPLSDFDGNDAIEASIASFPHFAHSACAER